jgi:hypothetical protein
VILLARFILYALIAVATVSVSRAMDDTSYPSRPGGVALSRSKDANLTCATPGAGSIAHLAAELFARTADIKLAP